ncbi:MAG: hypothetical protein NWP77_02435, partial [Opitutales bacterium]|nr:hypothetical protein [Opitutales bacterium]
VAMPVPEMPIVAAVPDADLWRFGEGTHDDLAAILGGHPDPTGGVGTVFRVWAPNAVSVSVVGDFNGWSDDRDRLAGSPAGMTVACTSRARTRS